MHKHATHTDVRTHYAHISQPESLAAVREKMALLCLVELVFHQKPEARDVSFAEVAEATKVPLDQVSQSASQSVSP
jgi:hypothetical protein